MMRRLTSTPSGLAGGANSRSVRARPGFRQTVAHEQHDVGAHARFAGRREHDSCPAQAVEIPQQSRRMHMLDDAADPFSERNGRPCPVDIRAQPGNERLMASRQQPSRSRGRVVHEAGAPSIDAAASALIESFSDIRSARLVSCPPRIDASDCGRPREAET